MSIAPDIAERINALVSEVDSLKWEKGEYTFSSFVEYFQLPQIVKVGREWHSEFKSGQYILLHGLFDRYAITAKPLDNMNSGDIIISDWFGGDCQLLTRHPRMKRRWWVFRAAFELYRFELPREIKVLDDTPAHMRKASDKTKEWTKVVLRKGAILRAVRRCQYKSKIVDEKGSTMLSDEKEGFVLQDSMGNEYALPPGGPLKFATMIQDSELHAGYMNHDGKFSIPEILMRYELPLDVELFRPPDAGGASMGKFQLRKFCVVKSVLGMVFGGRKMPETIELSPLLQFTLHFPRCLMQGLPQEANAKPVKVDQNELNKYRRLCADLCNLSNLAIETIKTSFRNATKEEVDGIESAHDISVQMESDLVEKANADRVYILPGEAAHIAEEKDTMPFTKTQPKSFTVHACIDQSNPYNEAIDYELLEENKNGGGNKGPPTLREAFVMQSAVANPITREQFAAALRLIPDVLIVDEQQAQ